MLENLHRLRIICPERQNCLGYTSSPRLKILNCQNEKTMRTTHSHILPLIFCIATAVPNALAQNPVSNAAVAILFVCHSGMFSAQAAKRRPTSYLFFRMLLLLADVEGDM